MKNSQCKSQRGNFIIKAAGGSVLLVALIIFVIVQCQPSVVVPKKQAALIAGIEARSEKKIERVLAESYYDGWGLNRRDAAISLVDVGSQFLALVVAQHDPVFEKNGREARVIVRLTIGGTALGPVGRVAIQQANQLEEPFVFTWQKQSWSPWSWRLVRMEQPEIPDDLYGYEPGDIRRAAESVYAD